MQNRFITSAAIKTGLPITAIAFNAANAADTTPEPMPAAAPARADPMAAARAAVKVKD